MELDQFSILSELTLRTLLWFLPVPSKCHLSSLPSSVFLQGEGQQVHLYLTYFHYQSMSANISLLLLPLFLFICHFMCVLKKKLNRFGNWPGHFLLQSFWGIRNCDNKWSGLHVHTLSERWQPAVSPPCHYPGIGVSADSENKGPPTYRILLQHLLSLTAFANWSTWSKLPIWTVTAMYLIEIHSEIIPHLCIELWMNAMHIPWVKQMLNPTPWLILSNEDAPINRH